MDYNKPFWHCKTQEIWAIIIMTFSLWTPLSSQNIENFDIKNPISFRGNISVGSSLYHTVGKKNLRSPFSYFVTANPTLSIYGFDLPFSITYRDSQRSISSPFNRISVNPSYKWVKLYLGKNAFQWSPYTLSGQLLNGVGTDLYPGKFRFSAVYGTLENPLAQIDTIGIGAQILPTYKRSAVGLKIGIGSSTNYFDLIAFRAKDLIDESDIDAIDKTQVLPQENIVIGSNLQFRIFKKLTFYVNGAASAITENQNSSSIDSLLPNNKYVSQINNLFTLNVSSKLQFAGDAGIRLQFKNFRLGLKYKRIDPFYKSLGTFYQLEDYENYIVSLGLNLFKGRFSFNGKGGIQRNNLNGLRRFSNKRTILNLNVNLRPSKHFTTNLRYSNFQSDRTPGFINLNDTIRYAQTTANYGITPRWTFGKRLRSTIQGGVNFMELIDINSGDNQGQNIKTYSANLTYSLQHTPLGIGATVSALGNRNTIENRVSERVGLSCGLRKRIKRKKLSFSLTSGYYRNMVNGAVDGNSLTGRFSSRWRTKNVSFSLNVNYVRRSSSVSRSFSEWRSTVRSTYVFNPKKRNK